MQQFRDRRDAGRLLASELLRFARRGLPSVVALPRGGVPVGFEVAKALGAPLDVLVVRKLGVPGEEELAMGAIASGGILIIDLKTVDAFGISEKMIEEVAARERAVLELLERKYRESRQRAPVEGREVILVDDGLATGSTMRAAVRAVREQGVRSVAVAVPVGVPAACERLRDIADEVICLRTPQPFYAVGRWYKEFGQITDDEVKQLLESAERNQHDENHTDIAG
jgi:predicted phosphoribosyltransferase